MKPAGQTADPPEGNVGGNGRRISAHVVLSMSPRPGSASAGRAIEGRLERETRSLEIDARRCKPQQAARLKTVHADGKSKRSEKLRLRKIGIGSSFGSGRSGVRKVQAGRADR